MNKLGRKTNRAKGKLNTVYKGKGTRLSVSKEVLILFRKALSIYGRKLFCRKNNLSFNTLNKKIAASKTNRGAITPIFQEDIQDWFFGLTGKEWEWNKVLGNYKITADNKNLVHVRNFIGGL